MITKKKPHLIVLAQSLEQPRVIKRIIEQSAIYEQIDVLGFKRQIHAVKNYSVLDNYDNVNINLIGSIPDGKYVQRIWSCIKLLVFLLKKYGAKSKTINVFGLDLRIISFFSPNKKINYEISDILWLYKGTFLRFFLGRIDKFLASISNQVIFTSRGFYLEYYKNHVPQGSVVIKENKLKTYGKVLPIEQIKLDKIRIAYIGAFRYENIIDSLLDIASKKNSINLNFYGDGNQSIITKMKNFAAEYKNISYNGPFKNPDDLERIYSENNLNFVVYDNTLENERVAMPNKYYESGYFNIPIVCAENTYVGERALQNGMGWITDIGKEDLINFIESISTNDLKDCHNRIKLLDKAQFSC